VKLVFTMLVKSSIYKFQSSGPFRTHKGREENGKETRQAPEMKVKKKKGKQTTTPVGSKQSGNSATHKVQQNAIVR